MVLINFSIRFYVTAYKEDVETVENCLRELRGYSENEIRAFKRNNYPKFISYCRRVVPSPKIILSRIDRLVEVFADLQDFSTRERLFKKATFLEIQNLTKHIVKNCLSDPVGVPMYMKISREGSSFDKSDLPITKWICLRSTSQLEGIFSNNKARLPL
jgi:hypothetical protein